MKRTNKLSWLIVAMGIAAVPVWACVDGSVRDAAFQAERDIHRLCVIANTDDPSAADIYARLETWLERFGDELNITLERINADDPGLLWPSLGIPSAPPNMPVVALVGLSPATRHPFVIDHWEPEPTDQDLAVLQTSPAREAIERNVANSWAVLLHSTAVGSDGQSLQGTLDAIIEEWNDKQPSALKSVRLDREDPRERLLCSFIGVTSTGPDWVGVVYGRGKLMAPPLIGAEINQSNLRKLVEGLAMPCTCLQDPTSRGLDIPMQWDDSLDVLAIATGPIPGYVEIPIEERLQVLEDDVLDESYYTLYLALIPLALISAAAIGATALILLRRGTARGEHVGE